MPLPGWTRQSRAKTTNCAFWSSHLRRCWPLGGVAYAVFRSQTAEWFGWFYGSDTKDALLSGDIAPVGQSYRLGDVIYTFEDAIYKNGTVYGTGTMRAADGANVVLIAEDYGVNEPAGYSLHYGEDETIPDDAPSYAGLATQTGAKIILARCVANGVVNADGTLERRLHRLFRNPAGRRQHPVHVRV